MQELGIQSRGTCSFDRAQIQNVDAKEALESSCVNKRVIKSQVWYCMGDEGITVADRQGFSHRTIARQHMGAVHDIAEMSNSDIVVATSDGVYHLDATGEIHIIGITWVSNNSSLKILIKLIKINNIVPHFCRRDDLSQVYRYLSEL